MTISPQFLEAMHRIMLIREAQASVRLDNDPRAQTISFEELTPEQQKRYEGKTNG